jgi:hypothetical protein
VADWKLPVADCQYTPLLTPGLTMMSVPTPSNGTAILSTLKPLQPRQSSLSVVQLVSAGSLLT